MNKISNLIGIYIIAGCVLLSANNCKTEKNTSSIKNHLPDSQIHKETSFPILKDVDTIFNSEAPKRITRNIKMDRKGNLLIAAYDDIIRYDGQSFSHLEKPAGIESWYAFDVLEDSRGIIWIASDQLGAFRINPQTGEVVNFTTADGLGNQRNMCVFEDSNGNIWIGGQGGLSKYNGKTFINYTEEDGLPHVDINTILEDHKGNIWFGTRGNAGKYDGSKFIELKEENGNAFFNVWSIIEDQSNNIWMIDSTGLWSYQNENFKHRLSDIWKIYQDSKGEFWYTGMQTGGASTLNHLFKNSMEGSELESTEVFQSEKMLFGIIEDKKGNIWIGGGDGVWRYQKDKLAFFTGVKKN